MEYILNLSATFYKKFSALIINFFESIHFKKGRRLFTFLLASAIFFLQCSSSMKIASVPEGAKIYIDQEYKGVTPYVHTDKKPAWADTKIQLKKDGFEDFVIVVKKNEGDINYAAGCTAILFLFPVIWLFDYPAEKKFELNKK